MAGVFVQEGEPVHHPRVEAVARMPSDLTYDVQPVPKPLKLASRRDREDRRFAILAAIAVLGYCLAIVSETKLSVV